MFNDASGQPIADYQSIHHRNEILVGPADPRFGASWQPFVAQVHGGFALAFSGAVQVPVGEIEPNPFAKGAQGLAHRHLFFGTGIFAPVATAHTSYGGRWFRAGVDVSGTPSLYRNRYDYLPPTRGFIAPYIESGFGLDSWTFRLTPSLRGETPALWGTRPDENSGRVDVSVAGSVFYRGVRGTETWIQVRITPYTYALGGQLTAPVFLVAGARWDVLLGAFE